MDSGTHMLNVVGVVIHYFHCVLCVLICTNTSVIIINIVRNRYQSLKQSEYNWNALVQILKHMKYDSTPGIDAHLYWTPAHIEVDGNKDDDNLPKR